MNTLLLVTLLALPAVILGDRPGLGSKQSQVDPEFRDFVSKNRRVYKSRIELETRYNIWKSNSEYVKQHNREADQGLHSFRLEINSYGDVDGSEFTSTKNGHKELLRLRYPVQYDQIFRPSPLKVQLPSYVDWRQYGYVTSVKNQGNCGSCWAFAATGVIETQIIRQTRRLIDLSEQELVDCSRNYDNLGCDGGFPELAMYYVRDNQGLKGERMYPYIDRDGVCAGQNMTYRFRVSNIQNIQTMNETALKIAVAYVGPVAVAMDASHRSFQFYRSGIYYERSCSPSLYALDHAVLVVGYGTDSSTGQDYWIVKNSWGSGWGEYGYVRIARNRGNHCGIATDAVYCTVRLS